MIKLMLPVDVRALALWDQFNSRTMEFLSNLPAPLCKLACQASTYSGSRRDDSLDSLAVINPVGVAIPWLFWETLGTLDDERLLTIAEGGALFSLASLLLDHLIDQQADPPGPVALLHQALYERGVTLFRHVLADQSWFWGHFEQLAAAHTAGLAAELDTRAHPAKLDLAALDLMASGKVAPIVVIVAALAAASGLPEVLNPIELSLKEIAVASQLIDDIGDWEDDVRTGHLTYYLAQLASADTWSNPRWPSVAHLQAIIDAGWLDVEHLQLVMDYLDRSTAAIQDVAYKGWLAYIDGYRELADRHMTSFIARHLQRIVRWATAD